MKIKIPVNNKDYGLFSLLAASILAAFGSFIYQTISGLGVTGLKEPVAWGLYVANFSFCLGTGAGILMLLGFLTMRGEGSDEFKFHLSAASLVSLSLAGVFILLDLGRIDRFYYMIIYPHPKSFLFWDFIILHILLGISAVFCFISLRRIYFKKGIKRTKKWGILISVFVAGLHLVTTETFSSIKARPEWHTPLINLIFLSAALLSGISVAMLLGGFNKGAIRRPLIFLLAADLAIVAIKFVLDRNNPLIGQLHQLFPFSFLGFLIIGNIVPIALILLNRDKGRILGRLVPACILLGLILKRVDIVVAAYYRRWLPFAKDTRYVPTYPEIVIVLGAYSAAIAAMIAAFYFIGWVKARKR